VPRRLLTAVAFLALAGAALTACGDKSNDSSSSGSTPSAVATTGTTTGAPSASAGAGGSTDTKTVCDNVKKLLTDQATLSSLGTEFGKYIQAKQTNDAAGADAAKKNIQTQVGTVVGKLRTEAGSASDAKTKTAINTGADQLQKMASDEYLANLKSQADLAKFQTDLTAALSGVGQVCP
jgi:hypothetical protein